MTDVSDRAAFQELAGQLSEVQKIEYRRRLDVCHASMASVEALVHERIESSEAIKEQGNFAKARWPWVVIGLAVLVHWGADTAEIAWLKSAALIVGLLVAWMFVQSGVSDWQARSNLKHVEREIARLLFHWVSAGAPSHSFYEYAALVQSLGTSPDWKESRSINTELRKCLLRRVSDLSVDL